MIASENDNEFIDLDLINAEYKRITENFDCTVVDGECGILSPLAPSVQNTELIKKLQIPVLIVNKPNINTVNNTLLTIYAAQEKGLNVRGVIINNIENEETEFKKIWTIFLLIKPISRFFRKFFAQILKSFLFCINYN